jgi:hypothetical protein
MLAGDLAQSAVMTYNAAVLGDGDGEFFQS